MDLAKTLLLVITASTWMASLSAAQLPLHQQAPQHGLTHFAAPEPESSESVSVEGVDLDVNGGQMAQVEVADLQRRVVLVHAFDWKDEDCLEQSVPFVSDFVAANADRSIGVLSIAPEPEGFEAATATESYGMNWPVALIRGEETSPYVEQAQGETDRLYVIGRSGDLAWQGHPIRDQKELLEVLAIELAEYPAPSIGRPLNELLLKALESYHSEAWKKAGSAAQKVLKKYAKKKDEESLLIAADAQQLIDCVEQQGRELLSSAKQFMGFRAVLEFLEVQQAAERGLPKTDVAKEIEELSKDALKDLSSISFQDTKSWIEIHAERPVMYPARQSRDGDRFDKEVEKFLRSTLNFIACTQKARYLREAYSGARE